ncbi:hypothetical protein MPSEU_000830400 [Mayamaea pseudoterrestris]|nr:hypothetical protein MPSEU_000830400 [Mayamaea pseudoterrestris]
MTINPCDPIYQVSKDFAPDKESTWPHPKEQDGWVLAHNSLRSEITALKSALMAIHKRGGIKTQWEIKALQGASAAHLEHIHAHHSNEDEIMTPFITTRAKYPDRLTEDHDGIVKQLRLLESMIMALKVSDNVEKLLKEFIAYEEDLLPHLAEEEEIGLPLMRAYFTPEDLKPAIARIVKQSTKLELGSLVGAAGEDYIRNTFMPNEGIPFFVWHIDFYWKYRLFRKQFSNNVQALVEGQEQKKSFLRTLL